MHKIVSVFILLLLSSLHQISLSSFLQLGGSPKLSQSTLGLSIMTKSRTKLRHRKKKNLLMKGGAIESEEFPIVAHDSTDFSKIGLMASLWGSLGVIYFLLNPMKRLLPLALLPFDQTLQEPHSLTGRGWVIYASFVLMMAYMEGYKGFQKKFSPMVVARASSLRNSNQNMWCLKMILAPLYSMGLIFASPKRLKISWGMVLGVSAIVAICKQVPYPWRSVVDGGVVVGLSWGALAIVLIHLKALLTGIAPSMADDQ